MGYTLIIGEAFIEYTKEAVDISAKLVRHEAAPAYGEPTDHENQRWPGYSAWADAMRRLGLTDVMFSTMDGGSGYMEFPSGTRYPLMASHPGVAPVTIEHVEYVEQKIAEYKTAHPDHISKYAPPKPGAEPLIKGSDLYAEDQYVDDPRYDSALCRGEWLAYWLRWAIDNCEKPVFVNT